jgi:hypothetical protein
MMIRIEGCPKEGFQKRKSRFAPIHTGGLATLNNLHIFASFRTGGLYLPISAGRTDSSKDNRNKQNE